MGPVEIEARQMVMSAERGGMRRAQRECQLRFGPAEIIGSVLCRHGDSLLPRTLLRRERPICWLEHSLSSFIDGFAQLAVSGPGPPDRGRKKDPGDIAGVRSTAINGQNQSRISASRFAIARSVLASARAQAALSPEGQCALR